MTASQPCVDCGKVLTAKHRGHLPSRCIDCRKKYNADKSARFRERNPDYFKSWKKPRNGEQKYQRWVYELSKRYGLTPEGYEALKAAQGGKCAICGGGPCGPGERLHVDHCHDTKKVRGLLCGRCNTAIGLLGHDVGVLRSAIAFLSL